jgi:hypothetical protein
MTAAEVGRVVGHLDLEVARLHHVEMTTVIAELAEDAKMDWPWTHDDPTVAVLRAFARLSLAAPNAVSERAWSLCRRVELAGDGDAGTASRTLETAP